MCLARYRQKVKSIDLGGPPVKVCLAREAPVKVCLARYRQNGRETDRYGCVVWCVHCIPGVNRDYPGTPRPVDVTMFCIVPRCGGGAMLCMAIIYIPNGSPRAAEGAGAPLERAHRSTTMSNR